MNDQKRPTKATKKTAAPRKPRAASQAARWADVTRPDPSPGYAAARAAVGTYNKMYGGAIGQMSGRLLYRMNGLAAFSLASTDNSAIGAGLAALADGRTPAEVVAGLERYCSKPKSA